MQLWKILQTCVFALNHRKKCDGENVKNDQLENEIIPENIDYKVLLIRNGAMSEQQKTMTEMMDK